MTPLADLLSFALPALGAVFAWRKPSVAQARTVAIVSMLASLAVAVLSAVVGSAGPLLPAAAGVPAGLSVFVAVIGLAAVALSPTRGLQPASLGRILLVNAVSMAFVLVRDPRLLAALFCASALPVWLELRSQPETRATSRVFAWYMLPSCALMVAGAGMQSAQMLTAAALPLAAGIAIREATLPFHSWFPHFVQRAPMGLVIAFVAPQLGVYAHLRMLSDTLPPELTHAIAAVGVVTVLFAAAMGTAQRSARRAIGYLMMSQTGLVAFGLETGSGLGRLGALTAWLVCGLSMAGLAMTVAALEARRGQLDLDRPGGSFRHIPRLATAYLLLGLASVGLPGTFGFVSEELLVQGSVERFPVLGLALVVGTALNSITIVRGFFALFTGARTHGGERDLTLREHAVLGVLVATLLVTGLWPRTMLDHTSHAAHSTEAAVEALPAGEATST